MYSMSGGPSALYQSPDASWSYELLLHQSALKKVQFQSCGTLSAHPLTTAGQN